MMAKFMECGCYVASSMFTHEVVTVHFCDEHTKQNVDKLMEIFNGIHETPPPLSIHVNDSFDLGDKVGG